MVKIHKSSAVVLDSAKPVIIKRPELGRGLRETMLAGVGTSQFPEPVRHPGGTDPVRAGGNHPSRSQTVRDAMQEADHLVEQARQKAAGILEDARRESGRIRQIAREEALAQAKKESCAELKRHIGQCDQTLVNLLETIRNENDCLVTRMEPQLLTLSVAVAQKIIGHELDHCAESFRKMVRCLIDRIRPEERLTLYVNDQDYRFALADKPEELGREMDLVKIVADAALPRGSCKLEGAFGQLDAGIETQIDELKHQWGITS